MNRILSFGVALGLVLAGAAGRAEATEYMFTLIDYPGATETWARGINDSGQIVGWYSDAVGAHGFTLSGGIYTSFDHPDAVISGRYGGTGAYGINNSGQIVGAYDASSGTVRGYLRDGDSYVDVTPFGSSPTWATAINDSGMVAGMHKIAGGNFTSYLFDGTSHIEFTDPDAAETDAWDINNAGVIVGTGWESTGLPHAFVWDASGDLTIFDIGGFPGGAFGNNDLGQIVGGYGPTPDDHWGFVLTGGVNATPDKLVPLGAPMSDAIDINNLGQVVGQYTHGTYADGPYRSFLATPIPDIPGDYNRNGVVDAADYIVWRDTLGSTFDMRANGDNSGASAHVIDAADYAMWRAHFGETAGGPAVASSSQQGIPEPASLLLAVLAATWLLAGRPAATKPRC